MKKTRILYRVHVTITSVSVRVSIMTIVVITTIIVIVAIIAIISRS